MHPRFAIYSCNKIHLHLMHTIAYVIVFMLRTCYGEVYGTLHVQKMANLVTVNNLFITLLTFELSCSGENRF